MYEFGLTGQGAGNQEGKGLTCAEQFVAAPAFESISKSILLRIHET